MLFVCLQNLDNIIRNYFDQFEKGEMNHMLTYSSSHGMGDDPHIVFDEPCSF